MEYEVFKLYWTRFLVADVIFTSEQFDEDNNLDEDEFETMQIWSKNRTHFYCSLTVSTQTFSIHGSYDSCDHLNHLVDPSKNVR